MSKYRAKRLNHHNLSKRRRLKVEMYVKVIVICSSQDLYVAKVCTKFMFCISKQIAYIIQNF